MGGNFSSNRDFNRVLARQPPTSINAPTFDISSDLEQQILPDALTIPDPVELSRAKFQRENKNFPPSNGYPFPNELFDPIQNFQQTNVPPPISSTAMPSFHNYPIEDKLKENRLQQSKIEQKSYNFIDSDLSGRHELVDNDVVVMSRSIMNRNDPRCFENQYPSSFQPHRSIVERNGRKFLIESKQRTERRYIRCVDEATKRLRYFEVIDCIPSKTIRPYKIRTRSLSSNDGVYPDLRAFYHSNISTDSNDQLPIAAPSSFTVKQALPTSSFEPNAQSFSDFIVPFPANKNVELHKQNEVGPIEQFERIVRHDVTRIPHGFKRIDPSFYMENNNAKISNEFNSGFQSLAGFDSSNQYNYQNCQDQCWKQPTIKNYDESVINNRSFEQPSSYIDESKMQMNLNQPSQPLYSYPKDLFTKI